MHRSLLTALSVLLLLTSSCISLSRLVDNSPLGETASPDRVNLWPIAYAQEDRLAVLWPIFDVDHRGFALRPLIAHEDTHWEVLPPLCYFDTKSGNWFSLGAYSFGENHGLFPFYNRGWINNVGPFWWDTDAEGDVAHGGLFPVVKLGPDFNYVGPAYWEKDDQGALESGGLFPLAHYGPSFNYTGLAFWNFDDTGAVVRGGLFPVANLNREPGALNWVGPAYWRHGEEDVASGGLFPLAHYGPKINFTGPVYWNKDEESGAVTERGLFPIAHLSERNEQPNWVGPVYWYKDTLGKTQFSGVFPLANFTPTLNHIGPVYWARNENGEASYRGIFPLVHSSPDLSFAGPVWWHRNAEGAVDRSGLFPLAAFTPEYNYVGPFVWNGDDEAAARNWALLPLAAARNHPDGRGSFVSLLGGRGWDESGNTEFLNVLGALYHYGRDQDEWWMSVPFFTRSEGPRRSRWDLWPLLGREERRDADLNPTYRVHRALTGIIEHQESVVDGESQTNRLRAWPLFSYRNEQGRGSRVPDYLSLLAIESGPESLDYHVLNPFIYRYRSGANYCHWSSFLGLAQYAAEDDAAKLNLGYFLYRQKSSATGTTRDIFPFITVDSGKEQGGFSLLWRLFRYQRQGDRVGGHFLFIPWGDSDTHRAVASGGRP